MSRSVTELRELVDPHPSELSVARQCDLLGLQRSSYYYRPVQTDPFNLELMHAIDRIYTRRPIFGVRRIQEMLRREGKIVNHKRVHRLMQVMGIQAIYPRRSLSAPGKPHRIYPYLLRGLRILHPDQVWSTDITYLPLRGGFVYLVAVMDWFSRYMLSWRISNTLDVVFCLDALEEALSHATPEIFNTDQGSQFTSADYTGRIEVAGIRMSMDGRGRALDNVFIERIWRSLKYEDIYLKGYETVPEITDGVNDYFTFYNHERPHQSLAYATPAEVYRVDLTRNRLP
jgi:putative transposase